MEPEFGRERVLDLLLYRDNPRHVHKQSQSEVIDYLLQDEEVYNLARHMSARGINPLEVIAVFPDDDGNLVVAEGNRRVCAAQLLTDPEKAPENAKARFRKLAKKSRDVSKINVARFDEFETAQPWLEVLHDGEQDGVGRKRWKPEQKARATSKKSTDALAVALLDYAQGAGIVSEVSRKKIRVSTVTRYLANPAVRHAMGIISPATSEAVEIDVTPMKFSQILGTFFDDIERGELHSRSVTKDWLAYAERLEKSHATSASRSAPVAVESSKEKSATKSKSLPSSAKAKLAAPETRFIVASDALTDALNALASVKLVSIYRSLTTIRLDEHPALLTTGAWVFIESLTALHGRKNTDFVSYLQGRLNAWSIDKDSKRDIGLSLNYISSHGNAEKHSGTFTAMDARNLSNHFSVIDNVLVRIVEECSEGRGK